MQTALAAQAPSPLSISAIEAMGLEDLRLSWEKHFGPPPPLRSVELMRLVLAWRLQAGAHGGIDRVTRRRLKRKGTIEAEGLDLGVGTVFTRTWQGVVYEIEVEDLGFRWNGTSYPSLSAVATAITGVRRNGPRFFGLREKK